ncbi:unnamed protein product [Amoebophrya sp. A120]|nr:unnamed protein product [Amoebophrya sp. A120]|eukprot:GSA120T00014893001.1
MTTNPVTSQHLVAVIPQPCTNHGPMMDSFQFGKLIKRARLHMPQKENEYFDKIYRLGDYTAISGCGLGGYLMFKFTQKYRIRQYRTSLIAASMYVGYKTTLKAYESFTKPIRDKYRVRLEKVVQTLYSKEFEKFRRHERKPLLDQRALQHQDLKNRLLSGGSSGSSSSLLGGDTAAGSNAFGGLLLGVTTGAAGLTGLLLESTSSSCTTTGEGATFDVARGSSRSRSTEPLLLSEPDSGSSSSGSLPALDTSATTELSDAKTTKNGDFFVPATESNISKAAASSSGTVSPLAAVVPESRAAPLATNAHQTAPLLCDPRAIRVLRYEPSNSVASSCGQSVFLPCLGVSQKGVVSASSSTPVTRDGAAASSTSGATSTTTTTPPTLYVRSTGFLFHPHQTRNFVKVAEQDQKKQLKLIPEVDLHPVVSWGISAALFDAWHVGGTVLSPSYFSSSRGDTDTVDVDGSRSGKKITGRGRREVDFGSCDGTTSTTKSNATPAVAANAATTPATPVGLLRERSDEVTRLARLSYVLAVPVGTVSEQAKFSGVESRVDGIDLLNCQVFAYEEKKSFWGQSCLRLPERVGVSYYLVDPKPDFPQRIPSECLRLDITAQQEAAGLSPSTGVADAKTEFWLRKKEHQGSTTSHHLLYAAGRSGARDSTSVLVDSLAVTPFLEEVRFGETDTGDAKMTNEYAAASSTAAPVAFTASVQSELLRVYKERAAEASSIAAVGASRSCGSGQEEAASSRSTSGGPHAGREDLEVSGELMFCQPLPIWRTSPYDRTTFMNRKFRNCDYNFYDRVRVRENYGDSVEVAALMLLEQELLPSERKDPMHEAKQLACARTRSVLGERTCGIMTTLSTTRPETASASSQTGPNGIYSREGMATSGDHDESHVNSSLVSSALQAVEKNSKSNSGVLEEVTSRTTSTTATSRVNIEDEDGRGNLFPASEQSSSSATLTVVPRRRRPFDSLDKERHQASAPNHQYVKGFGGLPFPSEQSKKTGQKGAKTPCHTRTTSTSEQEDEKSAAQLALLASSVRNHGGVGDILWLKQKGLLLHQESVDPRDTLEVLGVVIQEQMEAEKRKRRGGS